MRHHRTAAIHDYYPEGLLHRGARSRLHVSRSRENILVGLSRSRVASGIEKRVTFLKPIIVLSLAGAEYETL